MITPPKISPLPLVSRGIIATRMAGHSCVLFMVLPRAWAGLREANAHLLRLLTGGRESRAEIATAGGRLAAPPARERRQRKRQPGSRRHRESAVQAVERQAVLGLHGLVVPVAVILRVLVARVGRHRFLNCLANGGTPSALEAAIPAHRVRIHLVPGSQQLGHDLY